MKCVWLFLVVFLLASCPARAGDKTRIGILDTGITVTDELSPYLCRSGHKDLTGTGIQDSTGHGTVIANIVAKGIDSTKSCLVIIKWYDSLRNRTKDLSLAIQAAVSENVKIINISASGFGYKDDELDAIRLAVHRGVTLVFAAGNDSINLSQTCDVFPTCYPVRNPLVHVVANYYQNTKTRTTNYSGPVTDKEDGDYWFGNKWWSGTSFSAAKVTNTLVKHLYGQSKSR